MNQQQRDKIERQLVEWSGVTWTKRNTPDEPLLSDQIGFVLYCPTMRGPGGIGVVERHALENLLLKAQQIEAGIEVVI